MYITPCTLRHTHTGDCEATCTTAPTCGAVNPRKGKAGVLQDKQLAHSTAQRSTTHRWHHARWHVALLHHGCGQMEGVGQQVQRVTRRHNTHRQRQRKGTSASNTASRQSVTCPRQERLPNTSMHASDGGVLLFASVGGVYVLVVGGCCSHLRTEVASSASCQEPSAPSWHQTPSPSETAAAAAVGGDWASDRFEGFACMGEAPEQVCLDGPGTADRS